MKDNTTVEVHSNEVVETRPFPPFLPKNATVMMMGTFPPTSEKRAMEFHYPNFQNDMWRVFGLVFFDDKEHFRKGKKKHLMRKRLKLFISNWYSFLSNGIESYS